MRIVPNLPSRSASPRPPRRKRPASRSIIGALDASAPPAAAPGDAAPIVLKPPLPPVVLTPPPPAKREVMVVPPPRPPVTPTVAPVRAPAPMPPPVPLTPPLAAPQPTPAAAPATVAGPAEMVHFAKADTSLTPDGRALLDRIAATLAANDKLRLELVAHASGDPDDPVMARRVALQRAIVLRTYLIEHGVQSVRMDVRALGDKDAGDGPLDRVDLVLVGR